MPGPEDYAIESLATSLMGGTAEATTETFYTGKHVRMSIMRLDSVLEPAITSIIRRQLGLSYQVGRESLPGTARNKLKGEALVFRK